MSVISQPQKEGGQASMATMQTLESEFDIKMPEDRSKIILER
jgi:hypothetical protein